MNTAHPNFTINKSQTRIRCDGPECLAVVDVAEAGPEAAFAEHLAAVTPAAEAEVDDLWAVEDDPVAAVSQGVFEQVTSEKVEAVVSEAVKVVEIRVVESVEEPDVAVTVEPKVAIVPIVVDQPEVEDTPDPDPVEQSPKKTKAAKNVATSLAEPIATTSDEARDAGPATIAPAIKKRNIKQITEALGTVKAGDRVSATFKQPRYGEFSIEATVVGGLTHRSLVVGQWHIGTAGKPSRQLVGLVRLAAKGKHGMAIEPESEMPEHIGATA